MYIKVFHRFYLVVLAISLAGIAYAQSPASTKGVDPVKELEQTLKNADALINNNRSINPSSNLANSSTNDLANNLINSPSNNSSNGIDNISHNSLTSNTSDNISSRIAVTNNLDNSDIQLWKDEQKRSYNRVSGLEFRTSYDRKFGAGAEDIYDELYSYDNRVTAMLSWNILKSGFVGRSSNSKLVDLEGEKLLINRGSALSAEEIREDSQQQEQILISYSNNIYREKIKIYESLVSLLNSLKDKGQATEMELSQMEMEMEIAKGAIRESSIKVNNLLDLNHYLSAQKILSNKDVELLASKSSAVKQGLLDEEIISNKKDEISYWDEVSVSPYIKAQHYSDSRFTKNRVTANLGVSATLPIFTGTKSRRSAIETQSAIAATSTSLTSTSISLTAKEVATHLNKNLERLKAASRLQDLYEDQIKIAYKAYNHKQLSINELTNYYIKLFRLQADAIEIIRERESLKTRLQLIII